MQATQVTEFVMTFIRVYLMVADFMDVGYPEAKWDMWYRHPNDGDEGYYLKMNTDSPNYLGKTEKEVQKTLECWWE
jgi:hypothetical protein